MATTHGMSSQESHHFTIVESHTTKNTAHVVGRGLEASHGGIGQTILRVRLGNGRGFIVIRTTGIVRNFGSSRFFDRYHTNIGVKVGIGNLGKFGLDGFEGRTGSVETSIIAIGSCVNLLLLLLLLL